MSEDYLLFTFLSVAFSIAVLVVFFIMASNISKLKKDVADLRFIAMRYAKKDGVDLERHTGNSKS